MKKLFALVLWALFLPTICYAQGPTQICFTSNGKNCIPVSATNPFPVTGGGGSSSLGYVSATLTAWTTATAANTTQVLMPLNTTGYGAAILVQLDQTTTLSAGAVTFEGTSDGTNWVTVPLSQVWNVATSACVNLPIPYTLTASTNQAFLIYPQGFQSVRIKLSTGITGTGSITPFVTLLPFLPFDPSICNPLQGPLPPLVASTANIGNVSGSLNVTLTNCSGTIASGGTANNAFTATATKHGFTIANIDTTEVLWISFTGTAVASTAGSYPLAPATATTFANLSSFTSPIGFGINTALSAIAVTTGHKFSCTWW